MVIKAIIFDFDGIIVESMDIKARAFAFLFKDYPKHIDEIVKFHMFHGGMSRFEKFEWIYQNLLHKPLSEREKVELGRQFTDYVYQEVVKCPFVKGAKEFLDKYIGKYLFFIVSGTPVDEIKSIVKERGLSKYFKEVFGSTLKKNEQNAAILSKYQLRPEEVLFVGDSIDDWEGVKDLGIKFIGRTLKDNPFIGLKIEALIEDLFDLDKLIQKYV
ncbi:MAG: HAD-IA family hydrolase [bacterium]